MVPSSDPRMVILSEHGALHGAKCRKPFRIRFGALGKKPLTRALGMRIAMRVGESDFELAWGSRTP
jgi:hypothetical protein